MSYPGWASFAGVEVWNAQRTQTYADKFLRPGLLRGCDTCDDLPRALEDGGYTSPDADDAPWVSVGDNDTHDFYGFYPLSIEGIDDDTTTAEVLEFADDGGMVSKGRRATGSIRVSGVLVAKTRAAMEKGRAWMKLALRGSGCAPMSECGGDDLCYFAYCPDVPLKLLRQNFAKNPKVRNLHYFAPTRLFDRIVRRTNWLGNPSFEYIDPAYSTTVPVNWQAGTASAPVTQREYAGLLTGRFAARVTLNAPLAASSVLLAARPGTDGACPPSVAGERWSVSLRVRNNTGQAFTLRVNVAAKNAERGSGTTLSTPTVGTLSIPATNGWATYTVNSTTTTPTNTKSVQISFSTDTALAGGNVEFDMVMLEKATTAGAYFDSLTMSTYYSGRLWDGSVTEDNLPDLHYTTDPDMGIGQAVQRLVSYIPSGFVAEPGSEVQRLAFVNTGTAPNPVSDPIGYEQYLAQKWAARATVLTSSTPGQKIMRAEYFLAPDVKGKRFGYSFRARTSSGTTVTLQHRLDYWTSAGVALSTDAYTSTTLPSDGSWVTITVAAPAGAGGTTPTDPGYDGGSTLSGTTPGDAGYDGGDATSGTTPTGPGYDGGDSTLTGNGTVPNATAYIGIALLASTGGGAAPLPGTTVDVQQFLIEEVRAQETPGAYFDGDFVDDESITHGWLSASVNDNFDGSGYINDPSAYSVEKNVAVDRAQRTLLDVSLTGALQVTQQFSPLSCGGFIEQVEFGFTVATPYAFSQPVTIVDIDPSDYREYQLAQRYGTIVMQPPRLPACSPAPAPVVVQDPSCVVALAPPKPPNFALPCAPGAYTGGFQIKSKANAVAEYQDTVPVLSLYSSSGPMRNVRVRFYPNPLAELGQDLRGVDPCAFCGEFIVSYIPPNSVFTIDGRNRTATITQPGGVVSGGTHLLYGSGGMPFEWPVLNCNMPYIVAVETSNPSSSSSSDNLVVAQWGVNASTFPLLSGSTVGFISGWQPSINNSAPVTYYNSAQRMQVNFPDWGTSSSGPSYSQPLAVLRIKDLTVGASYTIKATVIVPSQSTPSVRVGALNANQFSNPYPSGTSAPVVLSVTFEAVSDIEYITVMPVARGLADMTKAFSVLVDDVSMVSFVPSSQTLRGLELQYVGRD